MTSHGMLEFVIFDPAQGEWPYTRSVLETSDPKAHYARSYDFMDIPKDKRNERRILGSETGLSILETLFDEYITVHGREG